jgi:hypothetical protein
VTWGEWRRLMLLAFGVPALVMLATAVAVAW